MTWPMLSGAFFGLQKPLKLPRCHALWCPDARWAALTPFPTTTATTPTLDTVVAQQGF